MVISLLEILKEYLKLLKKDPNWLLVAMVLISLVLMAQVLLMYIKMILFIRLEKQDRF